MQIVVLAGGLATRLGPLTERLPKSLLPVHGRCFLDYQLDLFRCQGIDDVVLCTGHLSEQIEAHLRPRDLCGMRVRLSDEGERRLGTAGAVKFAEPLLEEEFCLIYGDSYLPIDYRDVWRHFLQAGRPALMVVYRNENRLERSNLVVDAGRVVAYDKERCLPGMEYINFGLSVLRREALAGVPQGVPYTQEQWYQGLIERRELGAYETEQRFYEVGSYDGLDAFTALAVGRSTDDHH